MIAAIFLFALVSKLRIKPEFLDIPLVFETPQDDLNKEPIPIKKSEKVILKSVNEAKPIQNNKPIKEVFGLNRNSHIDESSSEGIEVKKGNTLTKASDDQILNQNDSDTLPIPTEEYLVSKMPKVLHEVKPIYPKIAKEKKIEGSVVMDILIDAKGVVRDVKIISGDDIFRESATNAIKQFSFTPAQIDQKNVAVKIRYILKFVLEY